jgi:hypothetical protein
MYRTIGPCSFLSPLDLILVLFLTCFPNKKFSFPQCFSFYNSSFSGLNPLCSVLPGFEFVDVVEPVRNALNGLPQVTCRVQVLISRAQYTAHRARLSSLLLFGTRIFLLSKLAPTLFHFANLHALSPGGHLARCTHHMYMLHRVHHAASLFRTK